MKSKLDILNGSAEGRVATKNSDSEPANLDRISVSVEIIEQLSELESIAKQWDELSNNVIEPNVFYESWMLIPAWRAFAVPDGQFFVLIWLDEQKTQLGGMVPLCWDKGYRRVPVRRLTTWKHLHCFSRVPLLRTGFETEVFTAFFSWLNESGSSASVLSFMDVDRNGPFTQGLIEHLTEKGEYFDDLDRFARPMLKTTEDYKSYLQDNFKRKARRNLNHSTNSLKKLGDLRYEKLESDSDPAECEQWLADFLALEAAGWKGKEGTALDCNQNESLFFKSLVTNGLPDGQVLMLRLMLDDKPIAMYVSLLATQPAGFCFKIAYDENLSKFSPGALLGHETTRIILDDLNLCWADSCAQPDHPLFSKLWRQERFIGHIHIGKKNLFSQTLIRGMSLVKKALLRME